MAKLGSDKRPAVVRVRTMPKGEEIVALCERHHWKGIVGIEPDQPEDLSDIDLLLRGPVGEPPAPRAAPRIGRNDYCPCRQPYDSDLTDADWKRLEPLVPAPKRSSSFWSR